MAALGLRHTSQVTTRDKYTKCDMELGLKLDGKELPNAAVLGAALEDAVKLIQDRITESYQVVPVRAEAPPEAVVTQMPVAAQSVPVKSTLGEQIATDPVPVPQPPVTVPAGLGFPPGYSQQ